MRVATNQICDRREKCRGRTGMVLETLGLRQTRYVTEGKSVGGEAPSGMVLETSGLQQTRYVTIPEGASPPTLFPSVTYLVCRNPNVSNTIPEGASPLHFSLRSHILL